MYRDRIRRLETIIEDQNKQINKLNIDPNKNQKEYNRLINERTVILNELSVFRKLQWEEDHEKVNLDDDR